LFWPVSREISPGRVRSEATLGVSDQAVDGRLCRHNDSSAIGDAMPAPAKYFVGVEKNSVACMVRKGGAKLVEIGEAAIEVCAHRLMVVRASAGCRRAGCLRGGPRPRGDRRRQGAISLEYGDVALVADGDGSTRTGIATGGPIRTGSSATKHYPRRDRTEIELDGLTYEWIARGGQVGADEQPPIARNWGRDHKFRWRCHFGGVKRLCLERGHYDYGLADMTGWNNDAGRVGKKYASQYGEERNAQRKKDRPDAHQAWNLGEVSASASIPAEFGVTAGTESPVTRPAEGWSRREKR